MDSWGDSQNQMKIKVVHFLSIINSPFANIDPIGYTHKVDSFLILYDMIPIESKSIMAGNSFVLQI